MACLLAHAAMQRFHHLDVLFCGLLISSLVRRSFGRTVSRRLALLRSAESRSSSTCRREKQQSRTHRRELVKQES
eukprot:5285311-Pleurochrysis_carterae.AAC.2